MASSCVNNVGTYSSYGWTSPNVSFTSSSSSMDKKHSDRKLENEDSDFEFLLEDPATMLSADQLFSDGKLVPLKFSGTTSEKGVETRERRERSCGRIEMEMFSPKAPSCTASWRELLGLKKTQHSSSSPNSKTCMFKHFLHRSSKSTASTSTPPLLKDSDISESASISSSRLSLSSSSSSSHELDDLPRLSLDLDKPAPNPFAPARPSAHLRNTNQQRIRMSKPRRHPQPQPQADESTESIGNGESRGMTVTADSPRLNASGKLVFHGLERSSSTPGSFSFTGGPRMKQPHGHGMPRSYSTNLRITPLLYVPVSSLRGSATSGISFGQLFSSSSPSPSSPGNRSVQLQSSSKNRSNRSKLESTSEV